MISIVECTALEFLTMLPAGKAWWPSVGIVYRSALLYPFPTHRELRFIYILLCTMPCMRKPLSFSRSEGSFVWVEVLTCQSHLRMFLSPSPPPYRGRVLDFHPDHACFLEIHVYDIVLYPLSVPVVWPDSLKPMKVLVIRSSCILGKYGDWNTSPLNYKGNGFCFTFYQRVLLLVT